MSTIFLLDTNMLSYIAKGKSPAARAEFLRFSQDRDAVVCISVITEAEVRYAMAKHVLSRARSAAIEGLLSNVEILDWDSEAAATYAQVRAKAEGQGITVSAMDMLIVAHAIAAGAVFVTADKIFSRMAAAMGTGITVNWASDIAS